jgi:hypothetical protein
MKETRALSREARHVVSLFSCFPQRNDRDVRSDRAKRASSRRRPHGEGKTVGSDQDRRAAEHDLDDRVAAEQLLADRALDDDRLV